MQRDDSPEQRGDAAVVLPTPVVRPPRSKTPGFFAPAVLIGLLTFASCAEPTRELYVAPDGNDANPGTIGQPFATLERARDEIRKSGPGSRTAATVHVRGGVYHLAHTLTLGSEDSGTAEAPIIYRAYRDERPVLSGGLPITGFQPHEGQILKADVRSQGLGGVRFRQLIFEGRRQPLARYPNLDPDRPFDSGWTFADPQPITADQLGRAGARRMLRVASSDLRTWVKPTDGEVSIFPSHEWWNNMAPITAFDRDRRIVTLGRNCSYEILPGDRYFVQGLREELDAPGEWYLDDGAGMLYFWPPRPLRGRQVCAPRLKTILEIGPGTARVTFRGIAFECCDGTAITIKGATHCLVADCAIRNVGDYAGSGIAIHGGAGNGIVGCDISDTGSHGIALGGGDERTLAAGGNYAENNAITRTGAFHKQGCGIVLSGTGNRASRNHLHHLPRFGVQFSGQNHLIELNHIHHVCLETMDTGAIYGGSLNWLSAHGTVIRHNFIHDIIGRSGKSGRWLSPYFAWGIYLDWTAMGVTVSGNIVARTPRAGIMVHDGRDNVIENNIIVDCGSGRDENGPTSQIEFSGWNTDYGWWRREIDNWCRQYDGVKNLPAWKGVPSLRDPRTAPLPDGRTMQRNIARRNILCWNDPQRQAFRFRNLSFEHNLSDSNLLWNGSSSIKTGYLKSGDSVGPDLAPPNAGFEEGAVGQTPPSWHWHIRPSARDTATISDDRPHSGARCLRLEGIPDPEKSKDPKLEGESWARIPSIKSAEIAVGPGKVYRVAAWFRAAAPDTRVELGAQAYRKDAYSWQHVEPMRVGTTWSRHECTFRFPAPDQGGHPEMKKFYVRIRLPGERGLVWVDDIQCHEVVPMDEWVAWQSLGMDRHSIVADPLFADAEKDDFRLKAESPAWRLGFAPIPFEKIGTYHDDPLAGPSNAGAPATTPDDGHTRP
ncbi:MAG TPA: right-handed parallel beta-helix repeat-containing protein [Verrucomicrobiae bacterium]|nr:right-handed parallel beta-helix repeat-containing protein [Verrucomicrobiae bacterium]